MLISHFATPWSGPHYVNPFHCKILGTPMALLLSFDVSQCNQLNFDCCLQDDTSGDYRKILLTLTGNQQFIK